MPVVGSSAYNTAGQITSLVRSLLNDAQGNLFTDTVLLPYANSAYRKTQRAVGNAGAAAVSSSTTCCWSCPRSRRLTLRCKSPSPTPPRRQVASHRCHRRRHSRPGPPLIGSNADPLQVIYTHVNRRDPRQAKTNPTTTAMRYEHQQASTLEHNEEHGLGISILLGPFLTVSLESRG